MTFPAFPATAGTCGIQGLMLGGLAFDTALVSAANALQGQLTSAISLLNSLPGLVTGIVGGAITTIVNTLTSVVGAAITSLAGHLTYMIGSLVQNLGLVVGQITAQFGLNGAGCNIASQGANPAPSDPCNILNAVFGSLMGAANAIMGQVAGAINTITGIANQAISGALTVIGDIMSGINAAVSAAVGFAGAITSMISAEIAGLAAALSDLLSFGAANALQGLFNNPCAKNVITSIATPALMSHLV